MIRMPYTPRTITQTTRILFPIVVTVIAGIVSPQSVALVGFLMFGNLLRECGVLRSPCPKRRRTCWPTSSRLLLGLTVAVRMQAESFLDAGNADDSGTRPDRVHV